MITNILWLFKSYRDLYFENIELKTRCEQLGAQLMQALSRPDPQAMETIRRFQDEVLSEVPFPDGKIPDSMWVSPLDDR